MGEGPMVKFFEGTLRSPNGSERIVLKRVKPRVEGAAEMNEMEHLLNVYAAKAAKNSVADFMGYCSVTSDEANRSLTEGLWLIWKYEGSKTLSYYLKRRDCIPSIAADMGIPEDAVVPTVMKQILENLQALHSAGLVHRDVKPLNIIFAEQQRRFKLIDLGACADLRTGTNYTPDESILDPNYCPPEQYCLPTDAPHLSKMHGAMSFAFSPVLWSRHRPDRFDSYCRTCAHAIGCTQTEDCQRLMRVFNAALKRHNHNLFSWRESEHLPARETAILDANDGEGWNLAEALLRPRSVQVGADGSVRFVEETGACRLPIIGALRHPFVQQAVQPVVEQSSGGLLWGGSSKTTSIAPASSSGVLDKALDIWHTTRDKLFDLESKMISQGEEIETQTTKVGKLKRQVDAGKARREALEEERARLVAMEAKLQEQAQEFDKEASSAASLLHSIFGIKRSGTGSSTEGGPVEVAAAADAQSKSKAKPAPALPAEGEVERAPAQSLLGSLFGWRGTGKGAKPATHDVQAAAPVAKAPAPAAKRRAAAPSATPTAAAPVETSQPEASGPVVESNPLADVAVNSLYTGLKFTGLALKVATDLAQVITKDAEKAFTTKDASPQVRRVSRQASVAFMDMLRKLESPTISSTTTWAEVAPRVANDERCIAVPEAARELMFETYVEAIVKLEKARTAKAEEAFRALLLEAGVTAQTRWSDVRPQLESQERFKAMPSEESRQRVFHAVATQLLAEDGFRAMLEELKPPISCKDSWSAVRRRVWRDRRCEAVPENRRKQIFEDYCAVVQDFELYQASLASVDEVEETKGKAALEEAPPAKPVVAASIEDESTSAEAITSADLQALRLQQEQLRLEYARMRSRLLELEMEMKVKDKLVESLDSDDFVNASIHSLEDESAIMFRFSKQEKMGPSPGRNGKLPAQNGKA